MNPKFIDSLVAQYFDAPIVSSSTVISQGRESSVAILEGTFEKLIIRIWNDEHGYMGVRKAGDIQGELAFMGFCRDNGIPVPQVLTSKQKTLYESTPDGRYVALMEYVDGELPHSFTSDMVAQIATTMAKMHRLVVDFQFRVQRSWPGTVIEMANDRIATFEAHAWDVGDGNHVFIKRTIRDFKADLARHDLTLLPQGAIHGDIMWENMKFKDGMLAGIFDFDDCRESYFVEDITKTLLFDFESPKDCVFGEDGKNVATFLNAYESVRQLTAEEKRSLRLFFMARFLYQVTSYYKNLALSKTNDDRAMYMSKIEAMIARFKRHQGFFVKS